MADSVKSTSAELSVQSVDNTAADTMKTWLGPIRVADLSQWSLVVRNTHAGNTWFDCAVDISNSTVETAADVPAASWLNINGDIQALGAGSAYYVAIENILNPLTNGEFKPLPNMPVRWVRFRAQGDGNGISGNAYFHGNR